MQSVYKYEAHWGMQLHFYRVVRTRLPGSCSFLVVLEARSMTEIVNCGSMLYSTRCGGACKQFFVALPFRNHMRRGEKNVAWKEFQDLAPFFIRLTAHNP